MKIFAHFLLLICLSITISYGQNPGKPIVGPAEILKNDNRLLYYLSDNLEMMSSNYTALDQDGRIINKMEFLKRLTSGNYLFIRLASSNKQLYYRLYKFSEREKKVHGQLIYAYMQSYYNNYQRVGKKFPAFDFVDVNGKRYNTANVKGKIVVLKCWFIGCATCVKEMPALNELVKKYNNRKDIVFISLAPDSRKQLLTFFKNRNFDYLKVPDQNTFITKTLKVYEYPTHFIINKQGIVVNVVNTPEEIEYTLKNDI